MSSRELPSIAIKSSMKVTVAVHAPPVSFAEYRWTPMTPLSVVITVTPPFVALAAHGRTSVAQMWIGS
jgi:hypothetical protein